MLTEKLKEVSNLLKILFEQYEVLVECFYSLMSLKLFVFFFSLFLG